MWWLTPILLIATAAHAQSVNGTVTDSITHAPIPNVIVTLLGPLHYNATTDEAGAFQMQEVHAGKYVVNVVKAGYVLPPARRTFQVDTATLLSVEMDPLGRVEGRVRYLDGRPAPRASVSLSGGGHNYTASADIGGNFLVEDVAPGSYILRAAGAPGDPKAEGEIWAPTYFPSTVDRAGAEPISVANGLTVARDIRLRSVPARRVHGLVRDETGELAAGVNVRLDDQTVVTGNDGTFEFTTRDGEWRLIASRKDSDAERRGDCIAIVSRHDVENLEIRLALPFSIPVIIERDDSRTPWRGAPPMVLLTRVEGIPAVQAPQNVYPGRYTAQFLGVPAESYLDSIKLGEMEVYNRPFDLWDGSQPLRITLRHGAASIRGSVESADAATVVVVDADESVTNGRWHMYSPASPRFDVGSLRPGDYYVFAVDRPTPLGLTDAIIQALLPRAEKVHLDKGAVSTLILKVIPCP